ncbi:MAG: cupin domain-containing protein [Planktomarina sp.]
MTNATSITHVDNEHVTVTEWRFTPGAATGWHRHGMDYVITPIKGGPVEIADEDGNRSAFTMNPGQSYFRDAGVAHDVIYTGDDELIFVEVELKSRQG